MKPGLSSIRVIHIVVWILVLQSHEYQARLVPRAGRERTVFTRGEPMLGSCAGDTAHSEDRAFLPIEFGHPFGNKRPRDRVFRNVRPDGAARRTRNRSPKGLRQAARRLILRLLISELGRRAPLKLPNPVGKPVHSSIPPRFFCPQEPSAEYRRGRRMRV